ncbi:hypothetical protein [Streptomyces sp. NPDC001435]|uniref:hypothetical protein n=1 Tax=unclassified Streptomyces TaxID=2593676 RepID=UPI00367E8A17
MIESRVPRWRRSLRLLLTAVVGPTLVVGALTASPAHAAPADDSNDSGHARRRGTITC